jgi:hypothetical protein
MRSRRLSAVVAVGLLALAAGACGSASRALVHEEDMAKVFPWPRGKDEVTIRVKPLTFWANSCSLLGSFEQVQVGPDTTFYILDELDKNFAYTPSRSPIRRLAPVQSIEIRWPVEPAPEAEADGAAGDAAETGADAEDAAEQTGGQAADEQPAEKPEPGSTGGGQPQPPKSEPAQ